MDQYVVPQFIEVEAKIIGPISARQFVEIMVGLASSYVWFRISPTPFLFIPLIFITLTITGVMAFAKVNGQSMHYFLLNLIQTLKRPRLKLWHRMDYKEPVKKVAKEEAPIVDKGPVTESRLASVSLMVDTGGVYSSDDYRPAGAAVSAIGPAQNGQPAAVDQAPSPDSAPAPATATRPTAQIQDERRGINLGG